MMNLPGRFAIGQDRYYAVESGTMFIFATDDNPDALVPAIHAHLEARYGWADEMLTPFDGFKHLRSKKLIDVYIYDSETGELYERRK